MCTLIVFVRRFAAAGLTVAANRDERLDRAASGPRVWPDRNILAPRDEVAGGTWLGLNAHGVFVGITNRHLVPVDASRPSRGDLVLRALESTSARLAFDAMKRTDGAGQNGFHLVMADVHGAFLVWGDGTALHSATLEPGTHVITERSFDAAPTNREGLLRRHLDEVGEDAPTRDRLIELLTLQPDGGAFDDVTVHVPSLGYGTRSSTLVRLTENSVEFRHANGPPTSTAFENYDEEAGSLLFEK